MSSQLFFRENGLPEWYDMAIRCGKAFRQTEKGTNSKHE